MSDQRMIEWGLFLEFGQPIKYWKYRLL